MCTRTYILTHMYMDTNVHTCVMRATEFFEKEKIYMYIYIQKIINNFSIALCPICVFIEGYKFLEFFKIRLFPIISYHGLHHQLRFLEIIIT